MPTFQAGEISDKVRGRRNIEELPQNLCVPQELRKLRTFTEPLFES
jgi:hypothetical protein